MTDGVDELPIPPKNQKALEDGINRLFEDRDLAKRLGMEARKIADKANDQRIYEQWRDYIELLCDSRKHGGKVQTGQLINCASHGTGQNRGKVIWKLVRSFCGWM